MKTQTHSRLRRWVYAALFAALCCVVTYIIIIPLPHGYVNAGDVVVLLSGFCLGPLYGGFAAALGSTLADLLCGYVLYAPATALIKFAVAALSALLYLSLRRFLTWRKAAVFVLAVSCLAGEGIMLLGYFLYECCLYGVAGAVISLPGNALQGVCCAVGAVIIISALRAIPRIRIIFPRLDR